MRLTELEEAVLTISDLSFFNNERAFLCLTDRVPNKPLSADIAIRYKRPIHNKTHPVTDP
jgi:hypothetical protein